MYHTLLVETSRIKEEHIIITRLIKRVSTPYLKDSNFLKGSKKWMKITSILCTVYDNKSLDNSSHATLDATVIFDSKLQYVGHHLYIQCQQISCQK